MIFKIILGRLLLGIAARPLGPPRRLLRHLLPLPPQLLHLGRLCVVARDAPPVGRDLCLGLQGLVGGAVLCELAGAEFVFAALNYGVVFCCAGFVAGEAVDEAVDVAAEGLANALDEGVKLMDVVEREVSIK